MKDMKRNGMKRAWILVAALSLVAAACSESTGTAPATTTTTEVPHEDDGHDDGGTHEEEPMVDGDSYPVAIGEVTSEYEVTLTEFSFGGDSLDLTPGETVRFILTNNGAVEHEFRLTTEEEAAEHLEGGHGTHGEETGDILVMVPPGMMRMVEMTLPADAAFDLVACLIPGHYEAGMFGIVE